MDAGCCYNTMVQINASAYDPAVHAKVFYDPTRTFLTNPCRFWSILCSSALSFPHTKNSYPATFQDLGMGLRTQSKSGANLTGMLGYL